MRKLAPDESPRQAMLSTMTEIALKLRENETLDFDKFDRSVLALGMATWFAWTEKINQYKLPMLSNEIEEISTNVMASWGWETETPKPPDGESGPVTPESALH
jgi:hypothetical protein